MALFKITMAVVTLVAIGWGYFSTTPVPPDVGEPWKYSLVVGTNKAIHLMAPYFGGLEFIQSSYAYIQYVMSSGGDGYVQSSNTYFHDVSVRVYEPPSTGYLRPGVMFYHGGGFTFNTPYAYDGLCFRLARDLDAVVVSVDYRKAPKHPIPTGFEDSKRATLYFFENSEMWEVDKSKIGAVGDGSGGGLVVALSLLLRDAGSQPQFAFLGLLSPAAQGLDFHLPSYQQIQNYTYDLSHRDATVYAMTQYFDHAQHYDDVIRNSHVSMKTYLEYKHHINRTFLTTEKHKLYCPLINYTDLPVSDKLEFDLSDPYNMPLMADDFADLPPGFVLTVESSGLRDEGVILARRLAFDGHVTHVHSDLGWYGMMMFVDGALDVQEAGDMADRLTEFAVEYT